MKPLVEVDQHFATLVHKSLQNLKIQDIMPLQRPMCPTGNDLKGIIVARDGFASGPGILGYVISQEKFGETCRLAWDKNKISEASMFSNETYAVLLSTEALQEQLSALSVDHSQEELEFCSTGDSTVLSHLFNPSFYLNDVNIRGYIYKTKTILLNLSIKYLNYREGCNNPADYNSKYFPHPVDNMNFSLYRYGDKSFLMPVAKVFFTVKQEVFEYTPLKAEIIGKVDMTPVNELCSLEFDRTPGGYTMVTFFSKYISWCFRGQLQ